MDETTYVCAKCKAVDHARDSVRHPQVLNCHNCGAGRGMEIADMLMKHVGMFPVQQAVN